MDHLPYRGRQFSDKDFEQLQNTLDRPFGQWNCRHTMFPVILGVSRPVHSPDELAAYARNSQELIEIDGKRKTRYEWTQEQRRIETAIRQQKDVANLAKACGDDTLRREAQANINALQDRYAQISKAAGLAEQPQRMNVAGFKSVKTAEQLKATDKSDIIISDKQLGKKAGKHMAEWGLEPSSADDRKTFIAISKEIYKSPDEIRLVQWSVNKQTQKRTVEVYAYIKGNDVVLVDSDKKYITTMKDGISNKRVINGRKI